MAGYTEADLDQIADRINNRPRQVLGWGTPAEIYAEGTRGALTV
jgi:IS30 family transposase